jgi:nucleoside-diphosphate-sugar epimerase
VYGPGDTTLLPRLVAGVRGGRLVLPEGAEVRHSLTHVDNLVDAVKLSLTGPRGTYNVADDAPVVLADVLREVFRRRRMRVRLSSIPFRQAFALAASIEAAARLRRRRPSLTRYAVSQLGLERTLDLTAARTRLGYRPRPTSLEGAERW